MLRIRWFLPRLLALVLRWACGPAFAWRGQPLLSKSLHNIPKLSPTGELIMPFCPLQNAFCVDNLDKTGCMRAKDGQDLSLQPSRKASELNDKQ